MPSRRQQVRPDSSHEVPLPFGTCRPPRVVPVEPSTGRSRFGVGSPLRFFAWPRVMRGVFRQVSRRSATRGHHAWPGRRAKHTERAAFLRQRPWGSPFAAFSRRAGLAGRFRPSYPTCRFIFSLRPGRFHRASAVAKPSFLRAMAPANLSPTANGQSRTLSIGFWEFSRRAIRFSRQPPKSAGAMLPWVFMHLPHDAVG